MFDAAARIGLGCATFGREITEDAAFEIMDWAVGHGIRFFDTAEAYGGGQAREYRRRNLGVDDTREVSAEMHSSEKIIGRWLRSRGARREITLTTKIFLNYTAQHLPQALDASLERLQTDSVDLYLFHQYDANVPLKEGVEAMAASVASGKARAWGCSNFTAAQLEQCAQLGAPAAIQSNYNILVRGIERDVIPCCQRHGIRLITYSPLAAGFLTSKYAGRIIPQGARFDVIPGHADFYFQDRNFTIVESLHALAARARVPAELLALAWVLHNPSVDVMLTGARHIAHLEAALQASNLAFDDEWAARVEAFAPIE